MEPVLIIIRGVSGSGKSTFAEFLVNNLVQKFDDNHRSYIEQPQKFEADQWFIDNDEPWNPKYLQTAHEWCQAEVRKSLQAGYITIVSNTTIRAKELDTYIDIAKSLKVQYFLVIADGDYRNVHDVPQSKVEKQASGFWFNNMAMRSRFSGVQ